VTRLLEWLASPIGAGVFFLLLFSPLFTIVPRRWRQRSELLLQHFGGSFSSLTWGLRFEARGIVFRLSRTASGRGVASGGSYPVLWTYAQSPASFVLCNARATRYFSAGPSRATRTLSVGGVALVLASDSAELIARAEALLHEDAAGSQSVRDLFLREFSHLSVKRETHVGGPRLFSRPYVVRYSGLPEAIYAEPGLLESRLVLLVELVQRLGIALEGSERRALPDGET
jgi:hypothetical protein